jgi:hypothetical protein
MKCNSFFSILILFLPSFLQASPTFIDISNNLQSPIDMIIYGLMLISFFTSFSFLLGTFFLYRRHCETPVHVPLSQVIFCFVLSLLIGAIPIALAKYKGYDFFTSLDDSQARSELSQQPSRKKNRLEAPPSNVPNDSSVQPQRDSKKEQRSKKLWED